MKSQMSKSIGSQLSLKQQRQRNIISPFKVQFKWSPCSIKQDFMKLSVGLNHGLNSAQKIMNGINNGIGQGQLMKPLHLINHFEGHRELTRKDELFSNLKSQLQHENENVFDYMPLTFLFSLPEGKQPPLEHFIKKFLTVYELFD